ncbi:MAG: hypothetical protein ACREIH_04550 [Nitrospiraceae bacterium]
MPRDLWDRADAALSTTSPPFSSISALARDLGVGPGLQADHRGHVVLVSPYWLRLNDASMITGDASVEVKVLSYWEDLDRKASVALVPRSPGDFNRRSFQWLGGDGWRKSPAQEGATVFSANISLAGPEGPCDIFLNYSDRRIDSRVTGLPPNRIVAHEILDPEFKALRTRLLNAKAGRGDRFEEGVAWLLHLCGFSATRYGYKDVQRSTDVIAFLGDAAAIYAECTTAIPDPVKTGTLHSRALELRSAIRTGDGSSIKILSLMFVAKRRTDVPSEVVKMCRGYEVVLVSLEDMEDLLEMARRGEHPVSIFENLSAGLSPLFD